MLVMLHNMQLRMIGLYAYSGLLLRKKLRGGIKFGEVLNSGPGRLLRQRLYRYVSECEKTRQETVPPTIRLVSGQKWSYHCTERKMVRTTN